MKKKLLLIVFTLGIGGYAVAQMTTARNLSSYSDSTYTEQPTESAAIAPTDSVAAAPADTIDALAAAVAEDISTDTLQNDNLAVDTLQNSAVTTFAADTLTTVEGQDTTVLISQQTITEETTVTTTDDGKKKKKEKTPKPKYGIKCNHWSIAGHVGAAFLDGDQHQKYNDMWPRSGADCSFDFMVEYTVNPGFGLFVEYAYNPYRGKANYYYYGAKDPNTQLQRRLSDAFDFDGLSHEVSVGFSLNMLNMFYAYRRQTWQLYLNAGAGFSFYNVKAYEPDTKTILNKERDGVRVAPSIEKGRAVTFPIGAMLEYNPTRWLAIALNIEYRLHAKDNFDATEKGNANDNTIYMSLGLRWKINSAKHKEQEHVRNLSPHDYYIAQGGEGGAGCCDQVTKNTQKIAELEELLKNIHPCDSAVTIVSDSVVVAEQEPDDDHDGVPNSRDREPNTPEGSFVNTWGQALDQAAIERILGYGQYQGEIPAIYFETGKAKMSLQAQMELAKVARKLYADPDLQLDIVGYCDNVGTSKVNNPLSLKRAEESKLQLVNRYGINANRINVYGKGQVPGPVDDFEPNRRCDFIMYKEKDAEKHKQEHESDIQEGTAE